MPETLIDREAWEQMKTMTEPAFMAELIDIFLIDAPELIDQMRAGLASNDVEGVRRAAHSLKSNSASFGASQLASAARELEMLAKGGALQGAEAALALVESEYERLVPALTEMKNEL